jgi:hypothetical protein
MIIAGTFPKDHPRRRTRLSAVPGNDDPADVPRPRGRGGQDDVEEAETGPGQGDEGRQTTD